MVILAVTEVRLTSELVVGADGATSSWGVVGALVVPERVAGAVTADDACC